MKSVVVFIINIVAATTVGISLLPFIPLLVAILAAFCVFYFMDNITKQLF